MKKQAVNPKPIYVQWEDHFAFRDGWGEAKFKDSCSSYLCETIGYLMYEDKNRMVVSLNICRKGDIVDCADSMNILKKTVVKRKYLKI